MRKLYPAIPWLPLIFFLALCIYRSVHSPVHDFANYYFGSYLMMNGVFDESTYEALIFNRQIIASGYDSSWVSYAPNPPFTTLLFLPLVYFQIDNAKLFFNIFSTVLFLFSLRRLGQHLVIPNHHIAIIPLIFILPIYNNISFGQVYFFLFFLLVEGYLAMEENRWVRCAFFWAIAIIFKITPGFLFFFLFFKKKYKLLIALSLACLLLFSISWFINGSAIWKFYISEILPKANQGEATAAAFSINYQSAHMFLKYLFIQDALDNPNPLFASFIVFAVISLTFKITVLTRAIQYTTQLHHSDMSTGHENASFMAWALWIVVSFLISPYGNTYGYILLSIPLLALYHQKKAFLIYMILSFVLINLPIKYLYDAPLIFQFPRLLLSIAFFAIFILRFKLQWRWQPVALLTCLFLGIEIVNLQRHADKSTYLFNEETHPLAYDYAIEDGYFCYRYWAGDGIQIEKTTLRATTLDFHSVTIINNQIFYKNQQITSSSDKKVKAALLNHNAIVYLSDKGRGYGFYAFRKIPLVY